MPDTRPLVAMLWLCGCNLQDTPAALEAAPSRVTRTVRGGQIEVVIPSELGEPLRTEVIDWVFTSADTVGAWYGAFPVPNLRVDVELVDGDGFGFASTWPGRPPSITAPVGRGTRAGAFGHDWMMVHEMTHTAFPPVEARHHWIEEGLSTYLEPWERVAAGRLSAAEAWHDFVRDLPKGVVDHGLDRGSSWAATYWGGALYCFLADLEVREQTGNRQGLRDAMKAILVFGGMTGRGDNTDLATVLAVGDKAVGTPALTRTWERMRDAPVVVDLPAIWRDLGVEMSGDTVVFHDDAPKAAIRKGIAPVP